MTVECQEQVELSGNCARPCICPDGSCQVLTSTFNPQLFEQGFSFHCIGRLPEAHIVKWRDSIHENDFSLCRYTPMKGLIRFFMTIQDFEILISSLEKVVSNERVVGGLRWQR